MDIINLNEKLSLFSEHWSPKILASLNGQHVKIVKLKGEFVWHQHNNEDELFLVLEGHLKIAFRDHVACLNSGEMIVVPKGVEHKPIAEEEVSVLLFEPINTINTGDTTNEFTKTNLDVL